jgi:DNA-binding CsgD family transcriptional regulator
MRNATTLRTPAVVQKATVAATLTAEGFILLSASMKLLFVNSVAAHILAYPQKVETIKHLDDDLASKIRSALLPAKTSDARALVAQFQSGKRLYLCRAFRVSAVTQGDPQPSVAVIFERHSEPRRALNQFSETFHLTTREQEVFRLLVETGVTTKEIAVRMGISPNTVKAFLRLIMVKMGVKTRSGIVAKALAAQQSQ